MSEHENNLRLLIMSYLSKNNLLHDKKIIISIQIEPTSSLEIILNQINQNNMIDDEENQKKEFSEIFNFLKTRRSKKNLRYYTLLKKFLDEKGIKSIQMLINSNPNDLYMMKGSGMVTLRERYTML